jgi:hypothetical protein
MTPLFMPMNDCLNPSAGPGGLAAARQTLQAWRAAGRRQIHEADSKRVLAAMGLPLPAGGSGGLSVVKYCCDAAMHKSEQGLVRLNVSPASVEAEARAMQQRARDAGLAGGEVLVEEMVQGGLLEWFVGCRNDATFGPIVVIGAGGIYAELFGRAVIRLAPLDDAEAEAAIRSHRAFAVIDGARGKPRADLAHFARTAAAVSRFYAGVSDLVAELDLNPVIVRPGGQDHSVVIADASIVLA